MTIHARALLLFACLIGFSDLAAAAVIRTQAPCGGGSGYCLSFFGLTR
jgi:hypothetical protein